MVVHVCPNCLKEFTKKSTYINHVENKKRPCMKEQVSEIHQNLPKFTENLPKFTENDDNLVNLLCQNEDCSCKYCNKTFTTIYTLKRHLNDRCKIKKLEDEKKENIFMNLVENDKINQLIKSNEELIKKMDNIQKYNEDLKKNNEELNKKNDELNKKIDKILSKNNKSVVNTQINNNFNITPYKINPFGKETFDKLNKKDILKIMTDTRNNGKHCINKLIDLIHFNNNLPENQNIYMSDFNRGKFMINDGKDWNISQNEEFILFEVLEHVRKLYFDIDDEEFEDKFENNAKFRNDFNTTFKKYYDYLYDELDDNELTEQELQKKLNFKTMMNTEVKNKLYNRRKLVMDNHEKIKNIVENTTKLLEIK